MFLYSGTENNTYGGVIILGVNENADGSWQTAGLKNTAALLKDFWNSINNTNKVSANILTDNNIETYEINGDYYCSRGVVIRKEADKIVFENPGYIRTGKKQMRKGGVSDPRNKALMKMFNLINIGERAGSGVPNIFNVWEDEHWEEPVIEEQFEPDRTILTLSFNKKATIKSDDKKATIKSDDKKTTAKTQAQFERILSYMQPDVWYKTADIMKLLDIKDTRAKELLKQLVQLGKLVDDGANRGKKYKLV